MDKQGTRYCANKLFVCNRNQRRERRVREMKKFDVLKAITDEEKFSDMVFDLIEVKKTPEALAELLKEEMPENELPHLKEAALNGYPLFFSGIQ